MKRQIIAFAGLSGAGKTTLLLGIPPSGAMQILHASELIKTARESSGHTVESTDALRTADLGLNQDYLVQGFRRQMNPAARCVVLDCHTVIEAKTGPIFVDPMVFEHIGITAMLFLRGEPSEIHARRSNDKTRHRPKTNMDLLSTIQDQAIAQARLICARLRVPLHVHESEEAVKFLRTLTSDERTP